MSNKRLDFLAIGDLAVDAFIRVNDAKVMCNDKGEHCSLSFPFGEKIPYESSQIIAGVGNSANAAVCAARLGLSSAIMSNVGKDEMGKECIQSLKKEGVGTKLVTVHKKLQTNLHFILWHKDERTILTKHTEYPLSFPHHISAPRWIYLSSLPYNSLAFHHSVKEYLDTHPETKLAFQPGTMQIKMGRHALKEIYHRTNVLLCNKQEAQKILDTHEENMSKLLHDIALLGPRIVIITDGKNGAFAYDRKDIYFQPTFPDKRDPISRTGAGDAFSATLISMLILGKNLGEALMRAPINSASVVQEIGAQKGLLNSRTLEEHLKNAPKSYKTEILK